MGLGLIPLAPGTFGSLGGLAIGFFIKQYTAQPDLYLILLIVLFTLIGVYCSNKIIPEWGNDPSRVVIDEVVGMWISMLFLPNNIIVLLAAFALFRLFDIYKPLYIRKFEAFPRGWGIMLDDVAAGCFANVALQLILVLKTQFMW
jgi:phosphatidylglycerophosphatase A